MKKVLCVLLAVLMLLSLCACANDEAIGDTTPDASGSTTGTTQSEKETEDTSTETKEEEKLQGFMFPLMLMDCKVPEQYGRKTNGAVAVVTGKDEFIATIYNGDPNTYSGDLEGILAFAAKKYSNDTAKFLLADLDPAELKASKTEKVTVSGYDAVKFSGPVKNKSGNTYEIYGYSMIIEDCPVMFVGVLCSDDQEKADLDDMKALIDLMAGSIYK